MERSAGRYVIIAKSTSFAEVGCAPGNPRQSDVNPVEENERQGAGADDDPEDQALDERAEADALEGFLVETRADEEERDGEADFAEVIQDAKCAAERR